MTITAAADGSALGNPGPAGWAWYIDEDTWHAGGWPHGTNNQGELMAVLDLLRSTAHLPKEPLKILCDSQYVINCLTKWMPGWKRKGWKKADGKPVLNVDLLKELDAALKGRDFTFEWVKGHAGHDLNEAADDRARAVATAYQQKKREIPSGPGFPGSGAAAAPDALPEPASVPDASVPDASAPDLFSVLEEDLGPAADAVDPVLIVTTLERRLLEPAVRSDLGEVARILHPAFEEIGSSGRTWTREEMLLALAEEDKAPVDLHPLSAARLGDDAILLQYRTRSAGRTVLRSSLWLRTAGTWRLRFHQGTPE
ncbi:MULTISPECIES: ribonuclease HI family protein [Arthrobacter]|uniref:Ribonuclease H n=2 Tax=Arthrobacter TaxID=1663 RepID=A0ABU9KNL4_9MICC|nr:ribonuclease HI family protein [Arthrobacter sp. YJM1]MDP5227762.1 ribonuclease HI family protein [Arthrobacter sp. YJM1]